MLGSLTDRLPRIRPRSRAGRVRSSSTGRPISISREVLLFVVGCALAAALIGGASFWVVNGAATSEAIDNAEVITQIDANGIVAPLLTPELLAGSPEAISQLDAAVKRAGAQQPRGPGEDLDGVRARSSTPTRTV